MQSGFNNTHMASYRSLLFDWALALNVDMVRPKKVAVNVIRHSRGVITSGVGGAGTSVEGPEDGGGARLQE